MTPSKFKPDVERLRAVFDRVERYVEDRWGLPVVISDVPHPFTGDLDGQEIQVDYDLDIEEAVFILVHLFGHTVQWNVSEDARAVGLRRPTESWSAEQLAAAASYEREACRYSIQLLHDAGIHDCDQWISDFSTCDIAYLMHFYTTGEKLPVVTFWQDGMPLTQPKSVPEFQPTRWISRSDGTVI